MTCTHRSSIDEHFSGSIEPREERTLREHLPGCDECRAYYERHILLSRLDPAALGPEDRLARGLGLRRRRPAVYAGVFVGLAAAAAVALFFTTRPHDTQGGFAARGSVSVPASSRVFVYEVGTSGSPELARDAVHASGELAFAYENGAAKRRLMLFGVDSLHKVYWFYPAWESPDDNPTAVTVALDARRHELHDAVRQNFAGDRLEVRSIFLDEALTVRDVEALLRDHPTGPLPIPGAVESSTSFTVVP